ncbi:MAG TPA: hypothetical protein VMC02_01585 [Steroidobacteraceae bacterium]|nr:hypothetical protein [Steroidobacteraceae bacterium]
MHRYLQRAAAVAAAWLLGLGGTTVHAAGASCDRACLKGFIDAYVAALAHHDPSRLPLAAHVRFTENGAQVPLGEALWVTFTKPLGYRHYFADPATGQVAAFITLMENDYPDYMMLRLRVQDHRISEIETILTRNTPRALTMPDFDPMWEEAEPAGQRLTRAQLIKGAVGYLTAVAMADGSLAPFSDDCSRTEVGLVSAVGKGRKPPVGDPPSATGDQFQDAIRATLGLSCAEQLNTRVYSFITGFDYARMPLVDVERQVVFGIFVFRRRGNIPGVTYQGKFYHFPFGMRMPDENLAGEAWKFRDGRITRVESTFLGNNVYRAGTGWPGGMTGVSRPIGK